MSILVTGPRGFVGARVMEELGPEAVPAPSLRDYKEEDIQRMVDDLEPELIIHTAAMSDISTCQNDPDGSYRANVEIPVWLARTGVKCVMFSTDQVYSGCAGEGPYKEEDTAPANLYACHKLEMEQKTLEINPDTVHLRATWMYDMPKYGVSNRGNFLMNMLRQQEISFSFTQHRAITYVREVAAQLRKAVLLPGGAYNYGSENDAFTPCQDPGCRCPSQSVDGLLQNQRVRDRLLQYDRRVREEYPGLQPVRKGRCFL